MRKKLITLLVAVIMVSAGLTGTLYAGETGIKDYSAAGVKQRSASEDNTAAEKRDEGSAEAERARKAEEARKAAEEAKKIIVARVNGAEINMFMLTRAMNRIAPKYVKEGEALSPETTVKVRGEALDRLIFEELAVQKAIKDGINPEPKTIEKVVGQVRENLGSEEAFEDYLDKNGLTEDLLKKLIEKSQRYELVTAREVYGKVKVDEKLLRDEYEKQKSIYILPDNYVVEDVFFVNGKDEEATEKKAEQILQAIKKNNGDVWKLVLDGTFIVRRMKITKERLPEIYKTMADLNAGDLSGVIRDKDGLHIIKVSKKEPLHQATFEEARPSIEPKFLYPAQEQRRGEWEKELRKDAVIEILPEEGIKRKN